jgi:osmotically inducible protein OsmC
MERRAFVEWRGRLLDGSGTITTESRALSSASYSFSSRFAGSRLEELHPGEPRVPKAIPSNPEELIAAAIAACFSMALASELEQKGVRPESVETGATVVIEKVAGSWRIGPIRLETEVDARGLVPSVLENAAEAAHRVCPVSRALNVEVAVDVRLKSAAA